MNIEPHYVTCTKTIYQYYIILNTRYIHEIHKMCCGVITAITHHISQSSARIRLNHYSI